MSPKKPRDTRPIHISSGINAGYIFVYFPLFVIMTKEWSWQKRNLIFGEINVILQAVISVLYFHKLVTYRFYHSRIKNDDI